MGRRNNIFLMNIKPAWKRHQEKEQGWKGSAETYMDAWNVTAVQHQWICTFL